MTVVTWILLVLLVLALVGVVVAYRAGHERGRLEAGAELAAAEARVEGLQTQLGDLRALTDADASTREALGPLRSTLGRVAEQVNALERDRQQQFGQLGAQLMEVSRATRGLRSETATLAGALKSSTTRGVWGETQLRRVLELAGLERWCDFHDQVTSVNAAGKTVRPDVVVTLPGGKSLVIDSKAPLDAFLDAQAPDLTDAARGSLLADHAAHLRSHVMALAGKEYWTAFPTTPEMVVCFVPADAILTSALDADPTLYDHAMARRVVLTSPATLIALLRTVAYTWQQEALTENARELLTLGDELYGRLGTLGAHVTKMGASLRRSVETYNSLVGALENRVIVTARRMHDLGLTHQPPATLPTVDVTPRPLTAAELLEGVDDGADDRDRRALEAERGEPRGTVAGEQRLSSSGDRDRDTA